MMNEYIKGFRMEGPKYLIERANDTAKQFYTDAEVKDGVVRWKSNNHIPPKDILEFWNFLQYDFDMEKTLEAHKKDLDNFFTNYRKNQKPPSDEEIFEMQAAFGKGTTVVDVISGRKIKL